MKSYLFLAFLFAVSIKMPAAPSADSSALQVEVLIFSGRPNPVFTVTDPAEIKEITALLEGMPKQVAPAATTSTEQPKLGYRGLVVANLSSVSPELQSLVVNHTSIQVKRATVPPTQIPSIASSALATPSAPELRVDGSRALENRLLTLARNKGVIDDLVLSHITSTK